MRWWVLGVVCLLVLVGGVLIGPTAISVGEVWQAIAGRGDHATVGIVRDLRLTRALLAFAVGGSLAVTGAALQALVRNPLADPYLLGLSGGAGLGAVVAVSLGLTGAWALPMTAFVGSLLAIVVVYRLAIVAGQAIDPRVLLLGGVVVGAFAASLMGAFIALSPAAEVRGAMLWLLGGFSGASWTTLAVFALYAVTPLALLFAVGRSLDLLALGEEPARLLGADVERVKRTLYVAASLLTAAAVAVAGIIGFVGLVVPHAIRLTWGHTHRRLLPAAFLVGGCLLVVADALARTAFAPLELPVGVVTAVIGVPVFVTLLRGWQE
ncbi:MAG TPA: iron ABC transporter permease [Gemmatimonadales bacterium]|jgi:iron complex transport system permease protein